MIVTMLVMSSDGQPLLLKGKIGRQWGGDRQTTADELVAPLRHM